MCQILPYYGVLCYTCTSMARMVVSAALPENLCARAHLRYIDTDRDDMQHQLAGLMALPGQSATYAVDMCEIKPIYSLLVRRAN